ncbi:hypothetical protein HNQ92_001436 [Rhabdobacter roseus]|uniref:Uncharacterized protein n=1 Tax=Rhabdobacter roseus TaxID=1655419 RepID=A0A840TTI7_9BACT|nr:hypothetical protein [Rhabdobacter roseus]MBB5283310.1 hypothetical protein [Rhabdobacter roseus]
MTFPYDEITIKYQTAPVVPAPHAHFYTLQVVPKANAGLSVEYTLTYLGREELDEEEILDEGFTLNDDFVWKGTLPAVWATELAKLVKSSQFSEETDEDELQAFVEISTMAEEKITVRYPANIDVWAYFLQEFIQAMFEASGRELPFEMKYLRIQNEEVEVALHASFAERAFRLQVGTQPPKQLAWAELQEVLKTVFEADFLADQATEKRPHRPGTYLTTGDGLWYMLGQSVVEPGRKTQVLPKIEALFSSLAQP